MTLPSTRTPEWWTRPSRVLPLVATIVILVALLTPQRSEGPFGDQRLSSSLAGTLGARVLADLAHRLGWTIVRDTGGVVHAGGGRAIHAVLAPPMPITREQAHRYLEAVRGGDALLLVLDERTPLSDSLGVAHFPYGATLPTDSATARTCTASNEMRPSLWPDGDMHLYPVRWLRGAQPGTVNFAALVLKQEEDEERRSRPGGHAAVGFPFGKGRIVVVGDPDLLRNDVLRYCRWGADVIAVGMLEWLRAGGDVPRTTLIFDEFLQGFGKRSGVGDVVVSFIADHPIGRAIFFMTLAGIVLIVAAAPRALVPPDLERIERRDPLEQVDALAHAYEQVRATRTVVTRLVRGVRWRVERVERVGPRARSVSDSDFLENVSSRYPSLRGDVESIQRALEHSVGERELTAVGSALHRIEDTLTRVHT